MDRHADSATVILIVAANINRDPVVNVGAEAITFGGFKLTDTVNESSNTFLKEVVKGASCVLERELVDDLVDKTEVVGNNSIKTTTICTSPRLKLLKLTSKF